MPRKHTNKQSVRSIMSEDMYILPENQREYSWRQRHVAAFWEGIEKHFRGCRFVYNCERKPICYMGHVHFGYMDDTPSDTYYIIDGQQRLTTLVILMCVVRARVEELGGKWPNHLDHLMRYAVIDEQTCADRYIERIRFHYTEAERIIARMIRKEAINAQAYSESGKNILQAFTFFERKVQDDFSDNPMDLVRFMTRVVSDVHFSVDYTWVADLETLFDLVNNRGQGLSPDDIIKNKAFSQADATMKPEVKRAFEEINAQFAGRAERTEFYKNVLLSIIDIEEIKDSEVESYVREENMVKHFGSLSKYIEVLDRRLEQFVHLSNARTISGGDEPGLRRIKSFMEKRSTHIALLMAGERLGPRLYNRLVRNIEDLIFVHKLLKAPNGTTRAIFSRWRVRILGADQSEFEHIVKTEMREDIRRHRSRIVSSLKAYRDDEARRSFTRYILSRIYAHVEEKAFGLRFDFDDTERLTIEHVMPSKITAEWPQFALLSPDEVTALGSSLGNLAFLDGSGNSSIQNASFEKKRSFYRNSQFLLNRLLAGAADVYEGETNYTRTVRRLGFFEDWDQASIARRQEDYIAIVLDSLDLGSADAAAGEESSGRADPTARTVSFRRLRRRAVPIIGELAIDPGTVLQFVADTKITCTVHDEKSVVFDGQLMSITSAATRAYLQIGQTGKQKNGANHWMHQGRVLAHLRDARSHTSRSDEAQTAAVASLFA